MMQESKQPNVLLSSSDIYCKPNSIGISRLRHYLRANNIPITTIQNEADFIIINTCGFTKSYENLTFDLFSECFKGKKPGCKVLAFGCLTTIKPEEIKVDFPELEMILDFSQLDKHLGVEIPYDSVKDSYLDDDIFEYIKEKHSLELLKNAAIFGLNLLEKLTENSKRPHIKALHISQIKEEYFSSNRTLVEIGSGCVSNCSYCIIKKAKGNPVSRPIDDIISDIRKSYDPTKVVAFVATDCASYGVDIGETLFSLVDRINREFPGIVLDITYINPLFLERHTDEYIEMFKKSNFDIVNVSLQSGSNKVIKTMNRHYNVENILALVKKLRALSPRTMFYSHFIAGSPGETWGDFFKTLKATRTFHYYNIFPFSPREGTKAAEMDNQNSRLICNIRAAIGHAYLALGMLYRLVIPHRNN